MVAPGATLTRLMTLLYEILLTVLISEVALVAIVLPLYVALVVWVRSGLYV